MNELKTTTKLVKSILEVDKRARNSDSILYLRVLERIAAEYNLSLDMSIKAFLKYLALAPNPYPKFESVRRTRQKVQATFPELASAEKVAKMRMENEKEYRAFALGDIDGN